MKLDKVLKMGLVAVSGMMLWGCTSTQIADLKDCGKASIGLGVGLDATAKAGSALHLGLGVVGSRTARVGLESRDWAGTWAEDQFVWPYEWYRRWDIFEEGTHLHDLSAISAYTRDYYPEYASNDPSMEVTYIFPILEPPPMRKAAFSYGEATDLELGLTLFIVSARIGINPLEIVDALGGALFNVDIAKDDAMCPKYGTAAQDSYDKEKHMAEMEEAADASEDMDEIKPEAVDMPAE